MAETVIALTKSQSKISHTPYKEAYGPGFDDMLRRKPNVDKLRALLGTWNPQSLEVILEDVIQEKQAAINA